MTSDEQKPTKAQRPLEWMRFDPVNFGLLCDGLTFAQVGALTKVMLHLWQKGPMQEADIRRIAKAEFDGIVDLLSPYNGGLSLELVEIAREHGQRRVSQTVKAGIASARKRNALSTNVEQEVNDRSTGVLSISISESYSKSKRKERAHEPEVIPAGVSTELWDAIQRWRQYRVEMKKKLTPSGIQSVTKRCVEMGDARAIAAIDHSIFHGYQGIYEERKQVNHGQTSEEQRAANYERILAERYPNG